MKSRNRWRTLEELHGVTGPRPIKLAFLIEMREAANFMKTRQ